MYRQIFTPTERNHTIPFTIPSEWYGKEVEFIVFPVTTQVESNRVVSDDDFMELCGAWESNQSAEEMIAEIKGARKFREKIINFD
jgi:hypothetical protein